MRPHEHAELDAPDGLLALGSRGWKVQQAQEWLCLHDFRVAVDGSFGPATQAAVHGFQRRMGDGVPPGIPAGVVDTRTWTALVAPLRRAILWAPEPLTEPGERIAEFARAYLVLHPREVGKPNGGPWTRYFCRGQEVAWCAGFATTVLGQALGHDDWYTLSCDELAGKARVRGLFRYAGENARPSPGDLFLIRRLVPEGSLMFDWVHTGIVTRVEADCFHTIEGNTNDEGSREGYEVAARIRALGPGTDFVLTGST